MPEKIKGMCRWLVIVSSVILSDGVGLSFFHVAHFYLSPFLADCHVEVISKVTWCKQSLHLRRKYTSMLYQSYSNTPINGDLDLVGWPDMVTIGDPVSGAIYQSHVTIMWQWLDAGTDLVPVCRPSDPFDLSLPPNQLASLTCNPTTDQLTIQPIQCILSLLSLFLIISPTSARLITKTLCDISQDNQLSNKL